MRALGWSLVVLVLVGGPGHADDPKPQPKPEPAKPEPAKPEPAKPEPAKPKDAAKADAIDISTYKDELVVLNDDDGIIYVARPRLAGRDGGPVFVGDGKVFYEQYLTGGGADGDKGTWSYAIWAPRVEGYDDAILYLHPSKKYFISCGQSKVTELRSVSKKEATRILATAEFRPRLHDRTAHLLARDEDGTYYYVDIDRDERQSMHTSIYERRYQHGHRVFVGKKGQMKELPMTNVVADSEGEIYQTKRGELRIVTEDAKTAYWVRGKKKTALKILPPNDNRYLIFRELGVYGFIGTACEEL